MALLKTTASCSRLKQLETEVSLGYRCEVIPHQKIAEFCPNPHSLLRSVKQTVNKLRRVCDICADYPDELIMPGSPNGGFGGRIFCLDTPLFPVRY